jgi:hypothetical protein
MATVDPARLLAHTWLDRNGWGVKEGSMSLHPEGSFGPEAFEDLVGTVAGLVAEMLHEAEVAKTQVGGVAMSKALLDASAEIRSVGKAVLKEASGASEPEIRERFRAMATAHEHDAEMLAQAARKLAKVESKGAGGEGK